MYQKDQVREMILHQFGGERELARSVGQGESSTQAQHEAAIQFWTVALSLDAETVPFDRNFALDEIARHQAALAQLNPTPGTRPGNGAV